MHESPTQPWTIAQLAKEAALSRSAFFERFSRAVGVAPIEYLLAWRVAMAKNLLWRKQGDVAEIAQRVGYSSASAFTRYVGYRNRVMRLRRADGIYPLRLSAETSGLHSASATMAAISCVALSSIKSGLRRFACVVQRRGIHCS